jgi:hypothetical protein
VDRGRVAGRDAIQGVKLCGDPVEIDKGSARFKRAMSKNSRARNVCVEKKAGLERDDGSEWLAMSGLIEGNVVLFRACRRRRSGLFQFLARTSERGESGSLARTVYLARGNCANVLCS